MPLINPNNLPDKFKSFFNNVEDVTFITDKVEKGNYLMSNISNASSNFRERSKRHNAVKSRIKSSSSDFGKTQIIFDNKYQKKVNNKHANTNIFNHYEYNQKTRNKKTTNKDFLKFISKQGSEKNLGVTGFSYKYGNLLNNFFSSLESDNINHNDKLKKSYSLFNV